MLMVPQVLTLVLMDVALVYASSKEVLLCQVPPVVDSDQLEKEDPIYDFDLVQWWLPSHHLSLVVVEVVVYGLTNVHLWIDFGSQEPLVFLVLPLPGLHQNVLVGVVG